ncbi:porin [Pleionea litopenaei]|uniref:Porin n=1 Tax=Pleionea litopenaei TaxID=3070815 RepID=A0AA51X983_9GAMM|nr:porin [Pleionea sp. HL-JVS1]WMS88900.1 porin [Pleionea sp. HL-JVS1]
MKLIRTAVATAVALGMAAPALAEEATVTPYGKINVTYQMTDDSSLDGSEVKSNNSRFGLKGKAKLSDSLKAIYSLEWQVDTTDKGDSSDDHIKARNQIVGLAGNFGEVIVGRHDSPLKKAQGKVDLFNDIEGDIKTLFNGEVRASNFAQYTSPKFGGVKIKLATMTPSKGAAETDENDFGSASSISVEYSNDDWFFAIAQDNDVSGIDTTTTRFTTQYKIGSFSLGAIYNEHDNGTIDEEGMLFSVAYKAGDHTLKLQTGESDELAVDKKVSSIGWDVKLGKATKVFAFYTKSDDADNNDQSWLGLGLEQKF